MQHTSLPSRRAQTAPRVRNSPDQWKPPNTAYWCTYATDWVGVKTTWGLTVTPTEAEALTAMLKTCGTAVTITQSPAPAPAPAPTPTPTAEATPVSTPSAESGPASRFEIVDLYCGATGANLEYVTIRNNGSQSGSLDGWSIHDEGPNYSYPFADGISLNPGGEVSVWSGTSEAKAKTLYWRSRGVWNNDGDTAFLRNPSGVVISKRACA